MFFVFDSIPEQYKTQEIYCPDKYITQRMCNEAVDYSLAASKFSPDWFVTSKMIKKLYAALYADDGLLFFDENSSYVKFYCDEMNILSLIFNNINLDNNFDEDDPDTIILIRLLACHIKFKKRKVLKNKSEELMPIARHPKKWWNFCMLEDEKQK